MDNKTTSVQRNTIFTVTSKKIKITLGLLVASIFVPYYEGEHIVPFPIGVFSKIFEIIGFVTSYKNGLYYECHFVGCIEFGTWVSFGLTLLLYYGVVCVLLSLRKRNQNRH